MAKPRFHVQHGDNITEDEWCEDCEGFYGFTWKVYGLWAGGVYDIGDCWACAECTDMEQFEEELMSDIRLQTGSL